MSLTEMAAMPSSLSPPLSPSRRTSALTKTFEHPLQQLLSDQGIEIDSSPSKSSFTLQDSKFGIFSSNAEGTERDLPPLSSLAFPINLPSPSSSSSRSRDSRFVDCCSGSSTKHSGAPDDTTSIDDLRSELIALKLELAQSKSETDANKCATAAARSENTALRTELMDAAKRREDNDVTLHGLKEEVERLRGRDRAKSAATMLSPRIWVRSPSANYAMTGRGNAEEDERGHHMKTHSEFASTKEMKPRNMSAEVVQSNMKVDDSSSEGESSHDLQCSAVLERNALLMENGMLRSDMSRMRSEVDELSARAARMESELSAGCSSSPSAGLAPGRSRLISTASARQTPRRENFAKGASSRWNLLKSTDISPPTKYVPLPPESLLWGSHEDLEALGRQLAKEEVSQKGGMRPTAA